MTSIFPRILTWFETDYHRTYSMKRYWGLIVLSLLILVIVAFLLRIPVQQVFEVSGVVTGIGYQKEEQKPTQIQFPVAGRYARDAQPGAKVKFKDNNKYYK